MTLAQVIIGTAIGLLGLSVGTVLMLGLSYLVIVILPKKGDTKKG